ncbi:hypothetical protein H310_02096 [Aphanomyces invadans]|uniref:Uncharacterized protein n=1 Tax=Aphanomyces invadans TaxID=157072 RepID=A0A024UMD8_9STRA|nr:hypothetical protein H310_02096 [Aphanomyces invadans]ETW07626.1 hypothetical protein H310_02096 [Aphanomyces invadans]|eukprot:XP_008863719.1 hypothetical protein H310_02096 [Aphanomyces invadans]
MQLCRYPRCRSYGKLDGLCLVHAKAAAAAATTSSSSASSPLGLPPTPLRLAFTPPPPPSGTSTSTHLPTANAMFIQNQTLSNDDGDDSPLVMVSCVPPVLANGRSQCFAPSCPAPTHGTTPFCIQHQTCVLLVDTQPRHPYPTYLHRKRKRSLSIENGSSTGLPQPLGGVHYPSRRSEISKADPPATSRRRQHSSPVPTPSTASLSTEHEHAQILANLGRCV